MSPLPATRLEGPPGVPSIADLALAQTLSAVVSGVAWATDHLHGDALAKLLAEDFVLVRGQRRVEGRDQYIGYLLSNGPKAVFRHHVSPTVVIEFDGGTATGSTTFIAFHRPRPAEGVEGYFETPAVCGAYEDRFRQTSQGWVIAQRTTQIDFGTPA